MNQLLFNRLAYSEYFLESAASCLGFFSRLSFRDSFKGRIFFKGGEKRLDLKNNFNQGEQECMKRASTLP